MFIVQIKLVPASGKICFFFLNGSWLAKCFHASDAKQNKKNQNHQILQFLLELSPFMREGIASTMIQDNYVKQLITVFRGLEQAGSVSVTVTVSHMRYFYV
jgi:hypothetical protein